MNNNKESKTQNANITNLLLGIIILFLAFLCIDQKYSYIKNNERQEKLHSLLEWHTSFVEMEFLKSEGRRVAFANHFVRQNLPRDKFRDEFARQGVKKLLTLGTDGIKAYLSLPGSDSEVLAAIEIYGATSQSYTPALIHKLPSAKIREKSFKDFQKRQEAEKREAEESLKEPVNHSAGMKTKHFGLEDVFGGVNQDFVTKSERGGYPPVGVGDYSPEVVGLLADYRQLQLDMNRYGQ